FFQAEDGIRAFHVTGVQTCALPIWSPAVAAPMVAELATALRSRLPGPDITPAQLRARDWWDGPDIAILVDDYDLVAGARGNPLRSEERRVGKECECGGRRAVINEQL